MEYERKRNITKCVKSFKDETKILRRFPCTHVLNIEVWCNMCQLHACAFASKLHWQSCLLTSHPVIPRVVVRIVYEHSDEGSGDVGSTANHSSRAIYVFFRSVGQSSKRRCVRISVTRKPFLLPRFISFFIFQWRWIFAIHIRAIYYACETECQRTKQTIFRVTKIPATLDAKLSSKSSSSVVTRITFRFDMQKPTVCPSRKKEQGNSLKARMVWNWVQDSMFCYLGL